MKSAGMRDRQTALLAYQRRVAFSLGFVNLTRFELMFVNVQRSNF